MRSYKRKTERGIIPHDLYAKAAEDVIKNNFSLRQAAEKHSVKLMTLQRYVKKLKLFNEQSGQRSGCKPKTGYLTRKIFNDDEEEALVSYLKMSANIYFGLTTKDLRTLAYSYANINCIKMPKSWEINKEAGTDWITSFLKRNKSLSIRSPEATSIGRATGFNRPIVNLFFDQLMELFDRYNFTAKDIYNVDETGVTTVQKPPKVIAKKGLKQVGAITSSERGTLVTVCVAVNAIGNAIPPMFIFPRKNFKDHFIRDGPPGCIGSAYPSGWMTGPDFFIYIKHFHQHTRSTIENPVLLLLDNHNSHISLNVIDFCKNNGIIMLSFPPHCSHKLQPLDRTVYGPFKKFINNAMGSWLRMHPGKCLTIYDIPGIVRETFPKAVTPSNIISGFKVAGIWPLNRDIFTDEDYLPSYVTDRPEPSSSSQPSCNIETSSTQYIEQEDSLNCSQDEYGLDINEQAKDLTFQPSTSKQTEIEKTIISPADIRPLPKCGPRQVQKRGRKKRQPAILTDTPVKLALLEEEQVRIAKANKSRKTAAKIKLKL